MFKKKKTFSRDVKKFRDAILQTRAKTGKKREKMELTVDKYFDALRVALKTPDEEFVTEVISSLMQEEFLSTFLNNLPNISFESKKLFSTVIFSHMIHRTVNSTNLTVQYMQKNLVLMDSLVSGYEKTTEEAKTCGALLRLLLEDEVLATHLLSNDCYINFFEYVEYKNFDKASDAFMTFKEMLTRHKKVCAQFLEKNYDTFFSQYSETLLSSVNYVTRRQSLKLLGELLLDRANFNVMTKYISERNNLVLMMNMLRDPSRNIQFEAFHVFKVFVANPNKARPILKILVRNKEKLIEFLKNFDSEKAADDEQFADEKAFLLKQIELLPSRV